MDHQSFSVAILVLKQRFLEISVLITQQTSLPLPQVSSSFY